MNRTLAAAAILVLGLAAPALAAPVAGPGPGPAVAAPLEPTDPDDPDDPTAETEAPPPEPWTVPATLTDVSPRVLTPGEELRLTFTLRNTGTLTATPRVTIHLAGTRFISRSSLDAWRRADPEDPTGPAVLTYDLPALAPGAETTATLVVPAAATGLTEDDEWGARDLAIEVVDALAGVPLGMTRSFAVWYPAEVSTRTAVTVAVPVTGPAVDPYRRQATAQALADLTAPEGRLSAVLAATEAVPVTWVVDPAVVTAARTSEAGAAWADRVITAAEDREVLLLPWGDADLTALTRAGETDLAAAAIARSEAAGVPGSFRLAWPVEPLPGLATAAGAITAGADAVVVAPGRLEPPAVLTYTPTGLTTVVARGKDVPVLVPDLRLSRALLTGRVGSSVPGATVTPAVAAQDLLAELAVISRERPTTARHLLATVPRDWTPDPALASAQLAAIAEAPWVELTGVAALLRTPDTEVDRGTLPTESVPPGMVAGTELAAARAAMIDRDTVALMLADPGTITGDPESELLAAVSQAWRADPAGRSRVLATAAGTAERLRAGVSVDPSSTINLISQSGEMPVRVVNDLSQDVTVVVGLQPAEARLVADRPIPVTVPARDSALVQIPLHAVGSGDVAARVVLTTTAGHLVDSDTVFTVRVRAEWENIGTAILAGLLAIGLAVSIVRTARRGRGASRGAPIVEAGPEGDT